MKKEIIRKNIFHKTSEHRIVLTKEIIDLLEPNDIIESYYEEPIVNDNDGYYIFSIYRQREETDEEYNIRLKKHNEFLANSKKKRYEQFLKLKKEFNDVHENITTCKCGASIEAECDECMEKRIINNLEH